MNRSPAPDIGPAQRVTGGPAGPAPVLAALQAGRPPVLPTAARPLLATVPHGTVDDNARLQFELAMTQGFAPTPSPTRMTGDALRPLPEPAAPFGVPPGKQPVAATAPALSPGQDSPHPPAQAQEAPALPYVAAKAVLPIHVQPAASPTPAAMPAASIHTPAGASTPLKPTAPTFLQPTAPISPQPAAPTPVPPVVTLASPRAASPETAPAAAAPDTSPGLPDLGNAAPQAASPTPAAMPAASIHTPAVTFIPLKPTAPTSLQPAAPTPVQPMVPTAPGETVPQPMVAAPSASQAPSVAPTVVAPTPPHAALPGTAATAPAPAPAPEPEARPGLPGPGNAAPSAASAKPAATPAASIPAPVVASVPSTSTATTSLPPAAPISTQPAAPAPPHAASPETAATPTATEPDARADERARAPLPGPARRALTRDADEPLPDMAVESTAPLNLDAPTLPVMPLPPAGLSTGAATAPTSPQTDLQLRERLFETVQQLLVGVTPGGAVEVRMVLRDNVLPGVTLIVQQAAGQLQVSFECTAQASQLRLERAGPAFAQTLARRLGRDVAMQVQGAQGGALRFDARPDAEEVTP